MKTLYVTDMDGTLLDGCGKVSQRTAEMLNDLTDRGALVTVATARTPATVQPLLSGVRQGSYIAADGTRQPLPSIVMTGGALWDRVVERYLWCSTIPKGEAEAIYGAFRRAGLWPFVYCLSGDRFLNVYHPVAMSKREDAFYQERRHLRLKRFHLGQEPSNWDKVALFFAIGPIAAVERACDELHKVTDCAAAWYPDIVMPDTGLIDLYAHGVSKAKAVRDLAKQVGTDRVVVFGDNLNDLPMMRVADVAVAVENALEEVKAEADVVIGRNTEDAVARFIEADFGQ